MSHPHHAGDIDWDAMADHLEREAELHSAFHEQAADWLRGPLSGDGADTTAGARDSENPAAPAVDRVLDVGSGPGVVTCLLARSFPNAEVVAVDQSADLLERVRKRAADQHVAGQVHTRQADLPDEFAALGTADLIWTSHVVHHLGDQQEGLNSLAAALRPGGVLAVVERGLPSRFLPRDIEMGRPGLQARLDALLEDHFSAMRADLPGSIHVVEDWPSLLAGAGLVPTGSRTFLTDHPAPLGASGRQYLHAHLTRLREQVGEQLDGDDRRVLDRLVDGDADTGVLGRPDAFFLAATTVHTARAGQ